MYTACTTTAMTTSRPITSRRSLRYSSCMVVAIRTPSAASSSAVLAFISDSSPRDSTLSRTSGSVFEPRRLKRQLSNSIESPSVWSMDFALAW